MADDDAPVYSRRAEREAYTSGLRGKAAPEFVAGDNHLQDLYDQGTRDGAAARRDGHPLTRKKPAHTPPAQQPQTPGYVQRAFSPSGAGRRLQGSSAGRQVTRAVGAGDSGGLLLALVIYPVVLATVKYGAAGPGKWFRAKWLNQPADTDSSGGKHKKWTGAEAGKPAASSSGAHKSKSGGH